MVIIETALIGTAGYAAWRGGEKAAHVGARKVEDVKRDRRRTEEQRGYNVKARDRSERLSQIESSRTAAKGGGSSTVRASTTTTDATSSAALTQNTAANDTLQKDRMSSIKERYSEARKPVKKKGFFSKLTGVGKSKK